jgi:RNAse (barnase) inhibitor barstar
MTGAPLITTAQQPEPVQVGALPPAAVDALCTLALSLGLDAVRIELTDCRTKRDLLARLARALEFPDWFGGNWDALADCLGDLGWRPAPGYVLVLQHATALRLAVPEVFDELIDILTDAALEWQDRGVPLRAFVDADSEFGVPQRN